MNSLQARAVIMAFLLLTPVVSAGEMSADERALTECKSRSDTFVGIESCLPETHVAFRIIDAFQEIYPPDAQPLRERCLELNGDSTQAAALCITSAINSALRLSQVIPDSEELDDPVFNAVRDESLYSQLEDRIKAARQVFPDIMIWGGGLYQPYK